MLAVCISWLCILSRLAGYALAGRRSPLVQLQLLLGQNQQLSIPLLDLDPQGRWFDPWCGHDKICTAVGPLSKALNPTLLLDGVAENVFTGKLGV